MTRWVEDRANELLRGHNADVKRMPFAAAIKAGSIHQEDFVLPYVRDLRNVIDMDAISAAGLKLGVDPLGGAARRYWEPINTEYRLDITVVNPTIDPTFSFMAVDHDGQIRMEDLGLITPDVYVLRDQCELPGMRVLQFAFDGHADNPYLPHNYIRNTVVYTGTHDNPTTRGWFEDLPDDQRQNLGKYLKRPTGKSDEATPGLISLAWSSPAALAMAPLQDLLNLGKEGRMNVPGRAEGNWRWRSTESMLSDSSFEWLRDLTKSSNRSRAALSSGAGRLWRRHYENERQLSY